MSEPLRLPFDQYQRYRLVSDVVERLRGGRARLRVLDVGGRTGLLRGFLPEDEVVLVDLEPSDVRPGLVLGTGSRLPFRSGAFDVVCAFDTLEHVPPEQRAAFVA
ncbi:MAG TPA: class I SAM-dependent methyltransferase, partial [Planctomycetota bacterium]|nr:class I SAM-dependent methyltransferase [Planctomycetota bacterium]